MKQRFEKKTIRQCFKEARVRSNAVTESKQNKVKLQNKLFVLEKVIQRIKNENTLKSTELNEENIKREICDNSNKPKTIK